MPSILTAQGLNFENLISYPPISIEENSVTFVTGPSGCGKSTLLRLFNGVLSPTAGTIRYHGQDIQSMDTITLRRQVLLAGQAVYLFEESIRENFNSYHAYREVFAPDETEIRRYLDLCRAPFPVDTSCVTLSGGERQRVYLAVCLSFLPKVLMLDEPTSALDAATGIQLLENLTAFCREKEITLITVSHDNALAERFASHTIRLERRDASWQEPLN